MKKLITTIILTVLFIKTYGQVEFYEFNTQIIFEVDGKSVSKKMYYESSFKIIDEKTIIWIYQSPTHNEQRYSKFFIQKVNKQNNKGVDVTIYHVINENQIAEESLIIKGIGTVNGEEKKMFEVYMNIGDNLKSDLDYNFKMRYLNE